MGNHSAFRIDEQSPMRKFEVMQILAVTPTRRRFSLPDWERYIDEDTKDAIAGWSTPTAISQLTRKGYLSEDEDVYLVVFRPGKLKQAVIERRNRIINPAPVESTVRSDLFGSQ